MPPSNDIDLKRLELEIRNKLAQEHNWVQQEKHWETQREQQDAQWAAHREHWTNQKGYWLAAISLLTFSIILNFFKA